EVQMQRRMITRSASGEIAGPWEDVQTQPPADRPALPEMKFGADGSASNTERLELSSVAKTLKEQQDAILRPELPKTEGGDTIKEPVIPYLHKSPSGFFDPKVGPGAGDPEIGAQARAWLTESERALSKQPPDLESAYALAEAAYWAQGIPPKTREDAS